MTHVTGLGDLLWLVQDPQFSILLRIDEINIRCARMQKEREISSLNTQRWSKIRNELDNGTLIIQDQRRASRR